jgi:hypothetical protein
MKFFGKSCLFGAAATTLLFGGFKLQDKEGCMDAGKRTIDASIVISISKDTGTEQLEKTKSILSHRAVSTTTGFSLHNGKGHTLQLELNGITDTRLLRNVFSSAGKLAFYEIYQLSEPFFGALLQKAATNAPLYFKRGPSDRDQLSDITNIKIANEGLVSKAFTNAAIPAFVPPDLPFQPAIPGAQIKSKSETGNWFSRLAGSRIVEQFFFGAEAFRDATPAVNETITGGAAMLSSPALDETRVWTAFLNSKELPLPASLLEIKENPSRLARGSLS